MGGTPRSVGPPSAFPSLRPLPFPPPWRPPPPPRARGAKFSGRRGAGWPSGRVGWRGALRRVERRAASGEEAGGPEGTRGPGHRRGGPGRRPGGGVRPGWVAGRPAGGGGVTRADTLRGPRAPGSEGPVGAAAARSRSSPKTAAARLPGRRRDGRRRRGPAARTPGQRCDRITQRRTLPLLGQERDRHRRRGGGVRRRRRGPQHYLPPRRRRRRGGGVDGVPSPSAATRSGGGGGVARVGGRRATRVPTAESRPPRPTRRGRDGPDVPFCKTAPKTAGVALRLYAHPLRACSGPKAVRRVCKRGKAGAYLK